MRLNESKQGWKAVPIAAWSKVLLPSARGRNLLSSHTSQTGDVTKQNNYSHRSELRGAVPIAEWSKVFLPSARGRTLLSSKTAQTRYVTKQNNNLNCTVVGRTDPVVG